MKKHKKVVYGFCIALSITAFYLCNRIASVYEGLSGYTINNIKVTLDELVPSIRKNPFFIGLDKFCLLAGLCGSAIVSLICLYNVFDSKKYMNGIEHGSAAWGEKKDIKPYIEKTYQNNILLTQTERLSMSDRMKRTSGDDYNRNKNVLVIGGSGSGKTRYFVKPNIMQMNGSYVITDPKGNLIHDMGKMLMDNGYKIKVFNLVDRDQSDKYNPFEYIRTADDILKLINNLVTNTNAPQSKSSGDFWEKAEIALLEAIFGYILFEVKKDERNMSTVMDMLRLAEVKEDNDSYVSPLDILFGDLKEEEPDHFAVRQYEIYKFAAGKTAKSILISVGVRLAPFNIESIRNMVSGDTIGLDKIGSERTALFIIIPDTDRSFNFLAGIMYQQMFDTLVYRADKEYKGKLPYNVRCLMDEFSNIGQIPMFEILIASVRSRGISINIVLQNLSQIKSLYKDTWEIITGNCDSLLFLGGMEQSTLEYISKICGKTTVDKRDINETKGQSPSYSLNNHIFGRELISPDEVGNIKGKQCILKIRGCNPFLSNKFQIEKHKQYKYLSESSDSNWFEIEHRYMGHENKLLDDVKVESVEIVKNQSA